MDVNSRTGGKLRDGIYRVRYRHNEGPPTTFEVHMYPAISDVAIRGGGLRKCRAKSAESLVGGQMRSQALRTITWSVLGEADSELLEVRTALAIP